MRPSGAALAVAVAVAATLLGGATPAAAARACPAAPAPPGAARPASPARIDGYLRAVARASPIVTSAVAGTSAGGRPLRYAVVSGLRGARLAAALARVRALRAGRTTSAAGVPAVVWLAGSVHGNEPSGADADLRVLAELARRCHDRRLARIVVVVLPVQNPDGRVAGTRVSGAGFDLNRDWLAATQPETVARLALARLLPPLAVADQHEQGGSAFTLPPYRSPLHPALAPWALRAERELFAPALRRALDGRRIARGGEHLDLLAPDEGDAATSLLGPAAGMTFEAGASLAFPRRVAGHAALARALVATVAAHAPALVREWARSLAPPRRAAHSGWALGPGARADAIVARLQADGVRIGRLEAAADVGALRPWGAAAFAPAALAAGTWLVDARQPLWRRAAALLDQGPREPAPPSDDDSAWSRPLLAGAAGGTLRGALPGAATAPAAPAAGPGALAGRRLALLADPSALAAVAPGAPQPRQGTAWARFALERQLGATLREVDPAALAAGVLSGFDTLVVADGAPVVLTPPAAAALRAWVLQGGMFVGWRPRGIAVARASAISDVTLTAPPDAPRIAGAAVAVLTPGGAVAVIDDDDPALSGAGVIARYGGVLAGWAAGTPAGAGAIADIAAGAGRVLLLAFDPVHRASSEAATDLLGRLLAR